LDAGELIDWQACRRRWSLSRSWLLRKWRAKVLADTLLRRGIAAISGGEDAVKVANGARLRLLELAVEPGLDMVREPYKVAHDWAALVEIILRYLGQRTIHKIQDEKLSNLFQLAVYTPTSWSDGERLHRWITVERWDSEALIRESHSWRTIGDIVAARMPMVLHAVEIGTQREGRRSSVWTRAWRHPAMRSLPIKFVKPADTTWKPVYFVDQNEHSAAEWVALAGRERAFEAAVHETVVACPPNGICEDILAQIKEEAVAMSKMNGATWQKLPMSRGACDLFYPCPYQNICYDTSRTPIAKMGLYVPRSKT
jgi:hypothetical protein